MTKVKKGTVNFFTGALRSKSEDSADHEQDDESHMAHFSDKNNDEIGQDQGGWQPKYKVPIQMFNIVEKRNRSIFVKFEPNIHSNVNEFVFRSDADLSDFCAVIEKNKKLLNDRLRAQVDSALGDIKLRKNEEITLLFDICSGTDLPRSDIGRNSDPYVTIRFNGKKIHKTDYISNDANPIWTLRKGSLFIWKVDALELFLSEKGLIFEVKDYDAFAYNESLGAFNIDARTLYNWKGERREFALKPVAGGNAHTQGSISLRVRRATEYDIDFMEKFNNKGKITTATVPNSKTGSALKNIIAIHSKKGMFISVTKLPRQSIEPCSCS